MNIDITFSQDGKRTTLGEYGICYECGGKTSSHIRTMSLLSKHIKTRSLVHIILHEYLPECRHCDGNGSSWYGDSNFIANRAILDNGRHWLSRNVSLDAFVALHDLESPRHGYVMKRDYKDWRDGGREIPPIIYSHPSKEEISEREMCDMFGLKTPSMNMGSKMLTYEDTERVMYQNNEETLLDERSRVMKEQCCMVFFNINLTQFRITPLIRSLRKLSVHVDHIWFAFK